MRRFFVEKIREHNGLCSIAGSEARHIVRVLRMKPGDRFVLLDGKGRRFQVVIRTVTPKTVQVVVEKPLPRPPPSPIHITLCQAITKSRTMDYCLQKTSELGVDRVVPFYSERTSVRYARERLANKMRHWREIAISSAKQCGRGMPMAIEAPVPFRSVLKQWAGQQALKVILWEEEESKDLKSALKASSATANFVGIIGPEGGFSREEVAFAGDAGFVSVSLGDRVLRAETAAITTAAIVQYELGDLCL